jgi:Druantia protein DruA/DDE_Tnp_1-associated
MWRRSLVVRPVDDSELTRFAAELSTHHWLGPRLSGRIARYVATVDDEWVALAGFGSAALRVPVREQFLGWDEQTRSRRLGLVAASQRLCVLPAGRWPNLASAVLARCLRRLCGDYRRRYGQPVLAVETFTDPARHVGTCYAAAGFSAVGATAGFGRIRGGRLVHGQPKTYWIRPLHRRGLGVLTGCFDSPLAGAVTARPVIDLNTVDIDGDGGLLSALARLGEHRSTRGVRHDLPALLAVATAAVLSGADGYAAIADYAANLPQAALVRLGIRYRQRGWHVAPSHPTLRRTLRAVNTELLDTVVSDWLWQQAHRGAIPPAAMRRLAAAAGTPAATGTPLRLFIPIVAGPRQLAYATTTGKISKAGRVDRIDAGVGSSPR